MKAMPRKTAAALSGNDILPLLLLRHSFPPDYLFALIKGFWGLAVFNEAWSKGCLWAVTVRSCHGIGLTHKTHT